MAKHFPVDLFNGASASEAISTPSHVIATPRPFTKERGT
jgi:hypothetical protein